jgi:hypothetical protein
MVNAHTGTNKASTHALVIPSRPELDGPDRGIESHNVRLRSAGDLCEVLRYAQDDTLLIVLSRRHAFDIDWTSLSRVDPCGS